MKDIGQLSGALVIPEYGFFALELAGNLEIELPLIPEGKFMIVKVAQPASSSFSVTFPNATTSSGLGFGPITISAGTSRSFGFWGFGNERIRNTAAD